MHDRQIIDDLITGSKLEEALDMLSQYVADEPDNAVWPYLRGKVNWRLGNRGAAITDYETAVALDPGSPAAQALTMSRDVMDFFNPDIFNP